VIAKRNVIHNERRISMNRIISFVLLATFGFAIAGCHAEGSAGHEEHQVSGSGTVDTK